MKHKAVNTTGQYVPSMHRQQGITLFELVVFILVVAIIFAYAFNRFREYPGVAERANFLAVTTQLKAGVNLRMMHSISRGVWHELAALEGSNPMDQMLENPSNYVGEFRRVDESSMPRRTWYFDIDAGELVYLVNDTAHLYALRDDTRQPTDYIRLRIRVVHDKEQGEWIGLVLDPVSPYEWTIAERVGPIGQ